MATAYRYNEGREIDFPKTKEIGIIVRALKHGYIVKMKKTGKMVEVMSFDMGPDKQGGRLTASDYQKSDRG